MSSIFYITGCGSLSLAYGTRYRPIPECSSYDHEVAWKAWWLENRSEHLKVSRRNEPVFICSWRMMLGLLRLRQGFGEFPVGNVTISRPYFKRWFLSLDQRHELMRNTFCYFRNQKERDDIELFSIRELRRILQEKGSFVVHSRLSWTVWGVC